MNNKIHLLTGEELAYIAGFLDGDGSIFSQIVRRNDYRLKFQIKTTVNFTQKSTRDWFLMQLREKIGCGVLKDRGDRCSDYTITENIQVKALLKALLPFLVIKKKTASLALQIIDSLSRNQTIESFIYSCQLVDKIATFTDSRNRTVTSETVRAVLIPS